jgi:hypothetical protein
VPPQAVGPKSRLSEGRRVEPGAGSKAASLNSAVERRFNEGGNTVKSILVCVSLLAILAFPAMSFSQSVGDQVYTNLYWSKGDTGFNEGGLCGVQALQGIAGIQLPNVPFEYQVLGNVWNRVNMMNAAIAAYRLGFTDAAVNAAVCSQVHNGGVYQLLSANRGMVAQWLSQQ